MLDLFSTHIKSNLSFLKNTRLVIAISGGIDSVVLAHLCNQFDLNFVLAHCNFNLRGKESDTDEDFVLELSEELNVEAFIQRFDTEAYAKENKCSIQMAARELRYDWFNDLAEQLEFDYILTAHQADDNLETFLINFTRGTGINGLTGIPTINENIVRPLLPFSREQVEDYAKDQNIKWREDSSNSSRKYLRNKLRHEVIPILKEINPQLLDSFQNMLENLNDTADIVEESLNAVAKRAIVDINESGVSYKVSEFKKVNNSKAYLFEMFKDYGFTEWNNVVNLLDAETGKYVTSNAYKLTKHRKLLILSDLVDRPNKKENVTLSMSKHQIESSDALFETPIGNLKFEKVSNLLKPTKNTIFIDKEKLKFPLKLRLWKKEDIFHPSGMKGKKKVSKYLKDEKLKPSEKENTWVLTSENKTIWVIGRRADERFIANEKSKNILKIELY
ncbi:MAG: tRNA lysidine(34) synthetase TilS [Winogradskyella sp.]|uniref:tRNA lysidine(34) synthetase TilS n=1 Tax=Winogradskyella sp. TaxID=1883156 RepID=UPI0018081832|nr:tRNA lysidine(34) synthetase TilS [Winogradskyella sp.]MBT8245747.1 tRNA lysidine(34) synthetase TilS [Winogradskyella sp.]NNK21878.1 tRNA lysidine(34) synthetase TilS [Winogradskyella sp.]